ncbi:amino acid adenylation domain-containing protein [Polyangium spumosum]|nr:amino acid adenylation domain-containing protein [Polyangium spumosum]
MRTEQSASSTAVFAENTRTEYPRDATVHALFEARAREAPGAVAAVLDGHRLTYGELLRRAEGLARRLRRRGAGPGVPVGIFVERSFPLLVGLVGILLSGGAYVPLDPAYPDERLRLMLREAGVRLLVAEPARAKDLSFHGPVLAPDDEGGDDGDGQGEMPRPSSAGDTAYIMFTSGSTGKPKGVAIPHRAVVRLVVGTHYVNLGPDDHVAQLSNLSFDASTFEIWGALLHGARLVVLTQEARVSPSAFRAAVRREGITVMFLTTALFHHLAAAAPDAFSTLDVLLFGGEQLEPSRARAVLRAGGPKRLLHVYGPTENTTFSTAHLVTDVPECAKSVPIGKPISNSTAYVLDEALSPLPPFVAGELYVGGDGLASGYVNAPELTAERFIPDPFSREPGARLYKTGDRAHYLPDGSIEFLGRLDRQVKIHGYRIELGEIEAALLACPWVREAVVTVREDGAGDKRLVAYAATDADAASLRLHLEKQLPPHLLPSSFVVLPALPVTPNGKIDRDVLPLPDRRSSPSLPACPTPPETKTEAELALLWSRLFGVEYIGRDDSFFDLGGDSLHVARLLLHIQEALGVDLPAHHVFHAPRLADLARIVDEVKRADTPSASAPASDWAREAVLDPDIRPCGRPVDESAPLRHVFLTGATGFLGAFLLRDLFRETDAHIYCLVRAADARSGLDRIRANLEKYGLWDPRFAARIVPVPGDLAKPLLGLSRSHFEALAARVQAIHHSGAEISYVKPYLAHRDTNVLGTREVLRLAFTVADKPVHHVSTIAVFGPVGSFRSVRVIGEDFDLDESAPYLDRDTGYSQSKWVAEKLCAEARSRGGVVTVFRPGFIMGDATSGAGNADDFIARLLRGCIQARAYPDLAGQRKDFVPVDYVSAAITRISLSRGARGMAYHLVPPAAGNIDLRRFFELLRGQGFALERLPYAAWLSRVRASIERSLDAPLLPLLPMLGEKVHEGRTRWELYEGMPLHDDTSTRHALAGSGITCPPMNAALLRKYLRWLGQEPPSGGPRPRPSHPSALPTADLPRMAAQ